MAQQGELNEGPLKIIGAGFGRTGTLSIKMAFEKLGYKTHHAHDVLQEYPEQKEIFYDILSQPKQDRISKELWNKLLIKPYKYEATVDWPTSYYFDELLAQNPGAKIVLSVRDNGDKWWNSVNNTIWNKTKALQEWPMQLLMYLMMPNKARLGLSMAFGDTVWFNPKLFDGKFDDKERSIKIYNDWIEYVKKTVPSDKLLIFNVKQGWDPLCDFLGMDKPKDCIDFPRSNSTKEKNASPILKKAIWVNRIVKNVVRAACIATFAYCCKRYAGY